MALAAMSSIGSAFAFSPLAKKDPQTYYAQKSGSSFVWTTAKPHSNCASTTLAVACTIVTSTPPTDGVMPSNQTATGNIYQ